MLDVPLCVSARPAGVIRPGTFAISADFSQSVRRLRFQLRHPFFIGRTKMLLTERFGLSLNLSLILTHRFARILVRLIALLLAIEMAVLRIRI